MTDLVAVLRDCGIEDAPKESELILTGCLGMDRVGLYRDIPVLSEEQQGMLKEIVGRRCRREPLQYIIGHVEFCGLSINVGPGVLIPRPETELLVEEVLKTVDSYQSPVISQEKQSRDLRSSSDSRQSTADGNDSRLPTADERLRILDLCTGSGCIALSLAKHLPGSSVVGTDISEKALAYARENARRSGIGNVAFREGDLFEPVKDEKFDIIVSNPPYIRTPEIRDLQPEIREWEPLEALDGGEDGLAFYRRILAHSGAHLNARGSLFIELGAEESNKVCAAAETLGFACRAVTRDYAGIERVLHLSLE
jgi:release factor glutamine methyltransferase